MKDENNLQKEISNIKEHIAQCRMKEQKADHDIIITQTGKINQLEQYINNFKNSQDKINTNVDAEIKNIKELTETLNGNINQTALIIKDLQNSTQLKKNAIANLIVGICVTVIAAFLLFLFSTAMHTYVAKLQKEENYKPTTRIIGGPNVEQK